MTLNKKKIFICFLTAIKQTMIEDEVLGGIRDFILLIIFLIVGTGIICGWFLLWIWLYLNFNKYSVFGIFLPIIPIALYFGKDTARNLKHNFINLLKKENN